MKRRAIGGIRACAIPAGAREKRNDVNARAAINPTEYASLYAQGMSDLSPNLLLPYLAAGQAQKHVTVNESLQRLDALVQLSVQSATTGVEPGAPGDGAVYILPNGKTGAHWGAMGNQALAYHRDGAWEEIAPRAGWLAYVADQARVLIFDGAAWAPLAHAAQSWRVLAASAVAAAHSGNTSETALASVQIPGGAMGPNGALRITTLWSYTNSANNKTLRIRLGGISGAGYLGNNVTTTATLRHQQIIQNRNAQNAQIGGFVSPMPIGASTSAPATSSIDTGAPVDLVISGQLANAGETVALESYMVELWRGA